MRKLLLSASAVALAIPGAAHADPYIAISGGLATAENVTNTGVTTADIPAAIGDFPNVDAVRYPAIPSGTGYQFETNADLGWNIGGQIGYAFDGGLRIELEGSYVAYDLEYHRDLVIGGASVVDPDANILTRGDYTGLSVGELLADARGDVESYGAFLNVLYDFDLGSITPYIGAGAGIYVIDADYAPGGVTVVNDADTTFAYQGIVGVSGDLGENAELFAEYKYRGLFDEATLDNALLPATLETDPTQHLGSIGIRFFLGGSEPEPVAVIPPPRPAPVPTPAPRPVQPVQPPAPPVCEEGPYIVFFDWDESEITPTAASVLNSAVSAYSNCGTARVMLAGHADRSGSATYNVGLSERRNAAVRDYLTSRGIPGARIMSEAFGESQNRVPTADGVREPQNRRVEVMYGPGSGM